MLRDNYLLHASGSVTGRELVCRLFLVHILCYGNTRCSSILLRGSCRGHRWLAAPLLGFNRSEPHIPARAVVGQSNGHRERK